MANRWQDWWRQAERDLEHARRDLEGEYFEYACFGAQQGSEKALKAMIMELGGDPWGHSMTSLLDSLAGRLDVPASLKDAARELGKFYIPARYPNGFSEGAPMDYFTERNAREALDYATDLFDYCRSQVSGL